MSRDMLIPDRHEPDLHFDVRNGHPLRVPVVTAAPESKAGGTNSHAENDSQIRDPFVFAENTYGSTPCIQDQQLVKTTALLDKLINAPPHSVNAPPSEARALAELASLLETTEKMKVECVRVGTHGVLVVKTENKLKRKRGQCNDTGREQPLRIQLKERGLLDRAVFTYQGESELVWKNWDLSWEDHIELVAILFRCYLYSLVARKRQIRGRLENGLKRYLIATSVAANSRRIGRHWEDYFLRALCNPAVGLYLQSNEVKSNFYEWLKKGSGKPGIQLTDVFCFHDCEILLLDGYTCLSTGVSSAESVPSWGEAVFHAPFVVVPFQFFKLLHNEYKTLKLKDPHALLSSGDLLPTLLSGFLQVILYFINDAGLITRFMRSLPRGAHLSVPSDFFQSLVKRLHLAHKVLDHFLFQSCLLEWFLTVVLREHLEKELPPGKNVWSIWNWLVSSFSTMDSFRFVVNELLEHKRGDLEFTVLEVTSSQIADLSFSPAFAEDLKALRIYEQYLLAWIVNERKALVEGEDGLHRWTGPKYGKRSSKNAREHIRTIHMAERKRWQAQEREGRPITRDMSLEIKPRCRSSKKAKKASLATEGD